jgi:hypothetical protein
MILSLEPWTIGKKIPKNSPYISFDIHHWSYPNVSYFGRYVGVELV